MTRSVSDRVASGRPGLPVVVLGAGPAGLAAAFKLTQRGWRDVTIVERGPTVGGNAGSFVIDGIPVDYGSHRLHPACPPDVMADLRRLLGDDLLDRPRNGRIRLRNRWLHFPLRPLDLLTRLPPSFIAGVLADAIRPPDAHGDATFASVLSRGLGRTLCRDFYFPYAEKIWGLAADELDAEQARRRVSSSSRAKMVRRILKGVNRSANGAHRFFYPRRGFGQISDTLRDAAVSQGARLLLDAHAVSIHADRGRASCVEVQSKDGTERLAAHVVFSTLPMTTLSRIVRTGTPAPASETLRLRALVLVYLTLGADRLTPFDAHYFPDAAIRISRLSEPKNYSMTERSGRTVLCAELPCGLDSAEWAMSDVDLRLLVAEDLRRAGLGPLPEVLAVQTRRLPNAYPIYAKGYRAGFDALDRWIGGIDGLVSFGRQGLFAHDNTHHTIAMAYAAVDCLGDDGSFDRSRWTRARRSFDEHVVED